MDRHYLSAAALAIASLTITGCDNARPEHTSEYYSQNGQEAMARLEVCGRLGIEEHNAECLNAQTGLMQRAFSGHGSVHLGSTTIDRSTKLERGRSL